MSEHVSLPFWNVIKNFFSKKFLNLPLDCTLNVLLYSEAFNFFETLSNVHRNAKTHLGLADIIYESPLSCEEELFFSRGVCFSFWVLSLCKLLSLFTKPFIVFRLTWKNVAICKVSCSLSLLLVSMTWLRWTSTHWHLFIPNFSVVLSI